MPNILSFSGSRTNPAVAEVDKATKKVEKVRSNILPGARLTPRKIDASDPYNS